MFKKICIAGDGAMGSVCAMMLCQKGYCVTIWGHDAGQLAAIAEKRENICFLPGYRLPDELIFQADDGKALAGADLLVSAVPCQFIRNVWLRLKPHVPPKASIVSVAKGIENKTLFRPTQILEDVLGKGFRLACLSGPTIADELARNLPATATVASVDDDLAKDIQSTFNRPLFRIYTNADIVGVELAGAMKNVIAIAAGVVDGMSIGDNAKAALVTRGLAEIERLGLAMGASEKTFAGLSGLGDLVTTCISPRGRNRSLGERIGRGMNLKQALAASAGVVEGVATCRSVLALARRYKVDMPITEAVHAVIIEGKNVRTVIGELMARQLKAE